MRVTAVLVTRGDVDMQPVLDSLPPEWPVVMWDNSQREDLSVYGRYAALTEIETPLVYVQDDDAIVSDPQAIVDAWKPGHVVCNMSQEFRHDGYTDSALVGFGACFERDLPARAFARIGHTTMLRALGELDSAGWVCDGVQWDSQHFMRTCDVVFTTLTPRILVDVPKTDREFASDPNRMWKQPDHHGERVRMLALARQVRDA